MCTYYNLADQPGIKPSIDNPELKHGYLDDEEIRNQLIEFSDSGISKVTFTIPSIHCASCIWLLEQLNRFNTAISSSRVDFVRKEVTITFRDENISLRELVELLVSLGYEPDIRLEDINKEKRADDRKRLYMQIGVAGFAFGNIMLLSFPEYLARGGDVVNPTLRTVFTWLNLVLVLPVVFFSGRDYLVGAWKGLVNKIINLDVPISLGILALFGRSLYEVASGVGPGYFDSLSGLIFLLLIGKLFQAKTYETLSFERDYTSYFPIAVIRKENSGERSVPVISLKQGDRIIIRNQELIPADAVIMDGAGNIDYSFVTGESQPVGKECGDVVYAGGRQFGEAIELEVIEEVSRSYLTRLWNHDSFTSSENVGMANLANRISKYFVAAVLLIATGAFSWHLLYDASLAFQVLTAVLIVACPCALALAAPFTLGTAMRIMGRNRFYLKNSDVIERLAGINHIVFDKTGTLTHSQGSEITWHGDQLSDEDNHRIKSLIRNSTHPVSARLFAQINAGSSLPVSGFNETAGRGIEGYVDGVEVRIGSNEFFRAEVGTNVVSKTKVKKLPGTFVEIDGELKGHFLFNTMLRQGVTGLIGRLRKRLNLSLLSGDTDRDKTMLDEVFVENEKMSFRQSPEDKLVYVSELKKTGDKVLMLGDGLNDAGALKESEVGIALTDDVTSFSPACDALLEVDALTELDTFIKFARVSVGIIIAGFVLSFLYNIIGLGFAVTGNLSPLVSAVLMPLSSITVVAFATFSTRLKAQSLGIK